MDALIIDISSEKLLTLAQAAEKLLESKASITRWIIHGTHGVRLEAMKFGAYWRTSEEALKRFGQSQTPQNEANYSPSSTGKSVHRTSMRRQREIDQVIEELDEAMGVRKCEYCRKELDAGYVPLPKDEKLWCPQCLVPDSTKVSHRGAASAYVSMGCKALPTGIVQVMRNKCRFP